MEIYVQSAGVSEQQDYIWQKITETGQKRVDEPILVKNFKDLLQTEAPSIFIGRESNKLILLVTGMKATQRKDYRNRTIRNSIALIAQDNQENEQKIRGIAVLALEGKLVNEIDSAIKEGGQWGFEIVYEIIKNLIERSSLQTNNPTGTKRCLIGKNSEENRKYVTQELQNLLPEKTNTSEALVVVTGIKAEDALIQAGVWRGLSNIVEKEKLSPYEKNFFSQSEKPPKRNSKFVIRLIISLGVIGLIILWLIWSPIKFIIGQNNLEPTNVVVAAISPSGQDFATVDSHGKAVLQNTQDKTNDPIENNGPIKSVAISSDGNYVATGDETGNVQLWDVTNKKKIAINSDKKFKHEKEVLSVTINAYKNNIKIVSGGADGKVLLWTIILNKGKGEATIEQLL